MMTFEADIDAAELRKRRRMIGLSMGFVSRETGLSWRTVLRCETENRPGASDSVLRIARLLNLHGAHIPIRVTEDFAAFAPHPYSTEPRPRCGARTRTGKPCQRKAMPGRKRCRNHGGLATGPRTPEGKARIAELNRARARERAARLAAMAERAASAVEATGTAGAR